MMSVNKNGRVILSIYVNNVCCIENNKAVEETITEIETLYKIKQVGSNLN